jgi:glycosyltransferase involved in cell wall biosynthesis
VTSAPGLSVVILSYNSASTIGHCLESLVNQCNQDFEVVLVDDDSTDDTVTIADGFSSSLRLSVVRNGSHSIPHGRNIGLSRSQAPLVAFLDSDDSAAPDWTQVIADSFKENPDVACLAGDLVPSYRTKTAHAIALNDHAIRRVVNGKAGQFFAGNSAINRAVFEDARFDEDFRFAEDLELMARVSLGGGWLYVPAMKVNYFSRDTLRQYAIQMRNYGFMKVYFGYYARVYRSVDFIPLALLIGGAVASLVTLTWWPVLLIIPFSFAEALATIVLERCAPQIAVRSFPAWLVKNVAWSLGILSGAISLAADPAIRRLLRSKRLAALSPDRDASAA